ncbi:MAG: hypothetical protein K2P74_03865 [Nitrosomonas sp.]|nr:hypothetical protein [Nitrosomonas sp.]
MNDEEKKIIISRISEYRQNESGEFQRTPVSPLNRWLTYAMLIPVVVVMVFAGIFFFAAFLALVALAVVVVGIRFWWLRRKYEKGMQHSNDMNRQSAVNPTEIIEDAQIIEETEIHRNGQKK